MPNGLTIRERLTRIETLLQEHITRSTIRESWYLRVLAGLVVGVILLSIPAIAGLVFRLA